MKQNLKTNRSFLNKARQRAEEEKNKTLAIITNFADGLLMFDKKNKLSLINSRAENFLAVKGKEVIKKQISEFSKFKSLKKITKILVGPHFKDSSEIKKIFREELIVSPNLILEVSTIPISRESQKFGTLVILHDVTREKRIERMKTEFVSISAHQLRTPLSAIKWTLRMLLDGDLGKITKEQKQFIGKTYNSNERMIRLINDLLNVTRIEEGKYLYKKEAVDIGKICQNMVKLYRPEIRRKNIKFKLVKPKKLLKVRVDKEKIKLAIKNIFENAVKYTPPKGEITISLKYNKKELEISISDTGVGIAKDQQFRVFTKFFRGANIIRMETEGTGLGLFIAKNIIEAHKGRIWFESEEGKGSIFYFTLPL